MTSSAKRGSLDNLGPSAELIDSYIEQSDTWTQKQLAEMEQRIWEALPVPTRRQWRRSYFLQEVFGGAIRTYQLRANLRGLGSKIEPLWLRLEPGCPNRMSITTAVNIARNAKQLFAAYPKKYPVFQGALLSALAEYDALPSSMILNDGTVVRKRAQGSPPSRRDATESATKNKRDNGQRTPKKFYGEVRSLVSSYIADYLDGSDDELAEQLYADFEVELKIVIRMLQQRLKKAKTQLGDERQLSDRTRRSHLRDDFAELGMDPPKPLLQPDMKKIRNQYRALARAYHPDKQPPGAPDLSAKFQGATEAYNRIVAYYRDQGIT
jgi:hypothetical protein